MWDAVVLEEIALLHRRGSAAAIFLYCSVMQSLEEQVWSSNTRVLILSNGSHLSDCKPREMGCSKTL